MGIAPEAGVTISRPDLGVLAYEYLGDAQTNGFIAERVLPIFDTALKSANFPVIPREAFLKLQETKRAPRGRYNRSGWEFGQDNYSCDEDGWEEVIDDSEARLYARFFDAEAIATRRAVNMLMRGLEKRVADAVFNTTTFTVNNVTNEWDDAANATPAADVKAGKKTIRNNTGLLPNVLIISYSTFLDLGQCNDVVDRIKYTNPNVQRGEISSELLAQYFGVDEVIVGSAIRDATAKGKSMSTATDLWSNEYAMLARVSRSNDLQDPSLGRLFLWTEDSPGLLNVETYREEQTRGNVVRVRHNLDEKIVYTACGYLLGNITT